MSITAIRIAALAPVVWATMSLSPAFAVAKQSTGCPGGSTLAQIDEQCESIPGPGGNVKFDQGSPERPLPPTTVEALKHQGPVGTAFLQRVVPQAGAGTATGLAARPSTRFGPTSGSVPLAVGRALADGARRVPLFLALLTAIALLILGWTIRDARHDSRGTTSTRSRHS